MYLQLSNLFTEQANKYNNPFKLLNNLLKEQQGSSQIIIEDFNLHYSIWSSVHLPLAYIAANRIIKVIIKIGNCQLLTPLAIITYSTN